MASLEDSTACRVIIKNHDSVRRLFVVPCMNMQQSRCAVTGHLGTCKSLCVHISHHARHYQM